MSVTYRPWQRLVTGFREVHGFELLRECFARLQVLRALNPKFHFFFNNVALGEADGVLLIAYNPHGDSRNATLVPGKKAEETRDVPVKRLDEYILQNIPSTERIKIIKIDVKGFEFSVLKGLEKFLAGTANRPAIVCEIKPWELGNLGATLQEFEQYMSKFGYRTYVITQEEKPVRLSSVTDLEVVVFRV